MLPPWVNFHPQQNLNTYCVLVMDDKGIRLHYTTQYSEYSACMLFCNATILDVWTVISIEETPKRS